MILKAPLAAKGLPPEVIETAPPVAVVLSPAITDTRPPAPEFPFPTTILRLPPAPLVADPVRNAIDPLLPLLVDPVLKDNAPLVPVVPALAVVRLNAPLEVPDPYPLMSDTEPPDAAELSPAPRTTRPPAPEVPLPTARLILPPAPLSAAAEPVRNTMAPLLPEDVVPVLKVSDPLIPDAPELAVRMLNVPLDVAEPDPLDKDIEPPVAAVLVPA